MTTFQEPQPQSRRAARQSERGENPEAQPGLDGNATQNAQGEYVAGATEKDETWDTVARRAAQLPAPAGGPQQPAETAEPVGEPLNYTTQSRPQVPSYDGPSFRNRVGTQSPSPEQPAGDEPVAYRVRDFSPEARAAANPQWTPPATDVSDSAELDYQTQAGVSSSAVSSAPAAPIAEVPFARANPAPAESGLTRRELRALREQQEQGGALPVPDAAVEAPGAVPAAEIETPTAQPVADPFAGFDDLGRKFAEAAATSAAASTQAENTSDLQVSALDAAEEALIEERPFVASPALSEPPAIVDPPRSVSSLQAPPPLVEPLVARLSASGIPQEAPIAAVPAATEPPAYSPPAGHWSLQAHIDDETQPYESTINRTIGGTGATTNALVLPSIPQASDMGPALTSTGEILLTGSIDVPHSLLSTGAHPTRFDDPGIDKLFDFSDGEGPSTDSAPVRAISAVSTHTSTQAVINTKKPQSNRMLTALLISASVMAVGVVGLLIASVAFNLF